MNEKIQKLLDSPYKTALVLCAVTALIHCLAYFMNDLISRDSIVYVNTARELLGENTPQIFSRQGRPPLLPMVMALGSLCGMNLEASAMLFVILTSAFIPLAIFMIAKELFKDNAPALLAALLAAIHPYFIRIGCSILRDPPCWACMAFAFAFILIAIRKREKNKHLIYWFLAGIFTGLTFALRKEGVELVLFVIMWFPVELYLHRDKFKEELLRVATSALSFGFALVLVSYPIYYFYTEHLNGVWNILLENWLTFFVSRAYLIFNS